MKWIRELRASHALVLSSLRCLKLNILNIAALSYKLSIYDVIAYIILPFSLIFGFHIYVGFLLYGSLFFLGLLKFSFTENLSRKVLPNALYHSYEMCCHLNCKIQSSFTLFSPIQLRETKGRK